MNLRSILCPVDFSEHARHALRWAGALAARSNARLTVLSVVDPLLAEAARVRLGQDLAKGDTEPALRELVAATWPEAATPANVAVAVRIGQPADVILETAANDAVDLIVMGTQGLGGVRKWILGSTTERVLRRTPTPVLAVPPPAGDGGAARAGDGGIAAGPIVAASDFSESSHVAMKHAALLARQMSAPLVFVHVVQPVAVPPEWRSLIEESEEARVAEAGARLKRVAEQITGGGEHDTIVSSGRPADLIASIAEERGAACIVMGLTGDRGPLAPRPGSIAYRVLSSTAVPVLVVPPPSKTSG
jgi:nucleotide-binding universal stress UspA family protein